MRELTVAAVQAEPVVLDAEACLDKAVERIDAAGEADLIAFPETFVPGYAHWSHDASFEDEDHKALYARLARNSLVLPEDLDRVQEAARRVEATVALPVTESEPGTPGTLYNTIAYVGPDGSYLGKHRKLVPTHHERTVYGYGDGDTLACVEVDDVRIGGLLCWNNYMPLARAALYEQGVTVFLAPTADDLESWQNAMRFVAREGRCVVVAPALLQRKSAFPADFELSDTHAWQSEPDVNERGGSVIVAPDGEPIEGPVYDKEAVLTATVDLDDVIAERQTFDPMGHYGRTDVLDLTVRGLEGDGG